MNAICAVRGHRFTEPTKESWWPRCARCGAWDEITLTIQHDEGEPIMVTPATDHHPTRDAESCEDCTDQCACAWHDGFQAGVQAQAAAVRRALDANL